MLLYSAAGAGEVVNREPTGFEWIFNMQDMTSTRCNNVPIGHSGTLRDIRDNKIYWVEKLNDGNCWMTQNLDLDLNASKALTSADSDVSSSWTPTENTQVTASPSFGTTNNAVKSWDPARGGAEKYCINGKCNNTSATTSNDYHDAQGNYYSWTAATAGTGNSSITSGNASSSICPKGWRLPENQASTAGTTAVKSYRNLLDSYGWSWNQGNDPSKYSNSLTGTKDGITYNIASSPLYFVYGGRVNSSSLNLAGSQGRYWSSTANSASQAYHLYFDTNVYPSYYYNRYYGFSVRCVAR